MTTSLSDIGLTFADGSVQSFAMGRNRIINGNFGINQRAVSGTVTLSAGGYGHDRFKAGASGCTYTFATVNNTTTLTISAGSLQQIIEGLNLETGTYTLSWTGTAQGKIGAGSYGSSGITGSITGGTNTTIEFGTGTVSKVQLEFGSSTSVFEQRPYGLELSLCKRYYELMAGQIDTGANGSGTAYATWFFQVEKRATPTIGQAGTGVGGQNAIGVGSAQWFSNAASAIRITAASASAEL